MADYIADRNALPAAYPGERGKDGKWQRRRSSVCKQVDFWHRPASIRFHASTYVLFPRSPLNESPAVALALLNLHANSGRVHVRV